MAADYDNLISELDKRGTKVEPSVGASPLQQIETDYDLYLGEEFYSMYNHFDGFCSYDEASYFQVWGLKGIITAINDYGIKEDNQNVKWIPIGDFLMDSDILYASTGSEKSKVKLMFEDVLLADSLEAFLSDVARGKLDLRDGSAAR